MWNGINYLTTLPASLDFLNRVRKLVEWFGFSLLRNPFLAPVEGTPLRALPPSSARHVQGSPMEKIREMEQLILEEERLVLRPPPLNPLQPLPNAPPSPCRLPGGTQRTAL